MKIRRLYSTSKTLFLTLVIAFTFTHECWGQGDAKSEAIYKEGLISEALHASMIPDNRTVGVYLFVGVKNDVSPQDWASTVEKYFKAYGFPVKIILSDTRPKGEGATAVIYIGAKAFKGNLSSGSVSLYHLLTEHEKGFGELLELYKKANPDLFSTKE